MSYDPPRELYQTFSTEILTCLRAAFDLDARLSGSQSTRAFCHERIAVIDKILQARKADGTGNVPAR